MFKGRNVFDFFPRDKPVFVSEYAVFDHGISTKPAGNLGVRGLLDCDKIYQLASHLALNLVLRPCNMCASSLQAKRIRV